MDRLLGEANLQFSSCLPSYWGSTFIEKICSSQEQILSVMNRALLEGFCCPQTQIGRKQKPVSLEKMVKN